MSRTPDFGSRSTADQVLAGVDLNGKHFLVTGCASGLGRETMQALAANGAHVIGMARTAESAAQACREVAYRTEPLACDLGDLDSINAAVEHIRRSNIRLDGIVANAAVAYLPALNTRYGIEMQFLVNHIGHFSVVTQLQDLLRDNAGRVVIVSDHAATLNPEGIMFDNLAGQRFYRPEVFYGQSKLANLLFTKELARRLRPRGIAVNAVDPVAARGTHLHRHRAWTYRAWLRLSAPFRKSPAQGSATGALLAASPAVSGVSGELWQDCRRATAGERFADIRLASTLWRLSEEIIASRRVPRMDTSLATGELVAA